MPTAANAWEFFFNPWVNIQTLSFDLYQLETYFYDMSKY